MDLPENFTSVTDDFIATLDLQARKQLGQYMTPRFLGKIMAQKLSPLTSGKVLDPAVGTGELLLAYRETHQDNVTVHGWDVDNGMLKTAQENIPGGMFKNMSLFNPLPSQVKGTFDRIIGNPPYFEIKKDNPDLENCSLVTKAEKGRLNIYALFFEYALSLLKVGGEMVFLVPPSMNNGAYFTVTRKHILENAKINSIEIIRENTHFADALTSVQIIHLTKTSDGYERNLRNSKPWVVDFNKLTNTPIAETVLPTVFTADKSVLVRQWAGKKNLAQLKFNVYTGKIPWNQVKTEFVEKSTTTIPLLYSKDISSQNSLVLKPELHERRWLPASFRQKQTGEKIIVNRIVGSLSNQQLRYCIVSDLPAYVTENHVNVIEPVEGCDLGLRVIADALKDSKVWLGEYLRALTGNTQLSAKELLYLIPFPG